GTINTIALRSAGITERGVSVRLEFVFSGEEEEGLFCYHSGLHEQCSMQGAQLSTNAQRGSFAEAVPSRGPAPSSRWRKRLYQLEKKFGFFTEPVAATTEKEWESAVLKRVREQENAQWLEAARTKSTLTMYAELKQQITAEDAAARAGALRTLVYKQRFDNNVQSTVCRVCDGESESAEHIILHCGGIRPSATSPTEEANRLYEGVLPLATALGFSTSERANTTEAFWKTIEQTKRRLEDWWHHTQRRAGERAPRSASLGTTSPRKQHISRAVDDSNGAVGRH
ncbi:hypothetical protein HPB47_007836, partial [Ixodes persulcatus]